MTVEKAAPPKVQGDVVAMTSPGGIVYWCVQFEDGSTARFPYTAFGKADANLFRATKMGMPSVAPPRRWYELERLEPLRDFIFVLGLVVMVAGVDRVASHGAAAIVAGWALIAISYLLSKR